MAQEHLANFIVETARMRVSRSSGSLLEVGPQERSLVRESFKNFKIDTFDFVDNHAPTLVGAITKHDSPDVSYSPSVTTSWRSATRTSKARITNWYSVGSEMTMMSTFERVERALQHVSSDRFDPQVYAETGFFIMRQAIPSDVVSRWQDAWRRFQEEQLSQGRNVNRHNPVALNEALPEELARIYREPVFIETVKQIFGENIALYNHRFVIKDDFSTGKVFLHQDSCYHLGNLNKCSLFVPLSIANEENGGMCYHAGSHKLGYLGDAGEINPDSFDMRWPKVTPELHPGDFVVMNSALWHESGPNKNGMHRILADMIMQPADDPTGKELLSGEWKTDIFYAWENCARYFSNSRVLKIIKYETELGLRNAPASAPQKEQHQK